MGKKILEEFEHGVYMFEEVEEMAPLGEDHQTHVCAGPFGYGCFSFPFWHWQLCHRAPKARQ